MDCPAVYFSFVHSDSRRVSVPNPLSRASRFGKLTSWKLQLGSLLLTHTFKIPQNGGQKAGSDFKGTQSSKYLQYIFLSLSPNSESGEIQIVLHPTKQYNSQSISYCPQVQSAGLAGGFPDKQRLQGLYYNTYK